ncbi:MAG: lytic transglycosylase domain-containing protein [Myxococcaceae bacterium]|nr:lytic transglycosylase domain-containing protein [Myxococcaceae bacterium]
MPRPVPLAIAKIGPCALAAILFAAQLSLVPRAEAEELYRYWDDGVLVLSNIAPSDGRRTVRVRQQNGVTRLTLRGSEAAASRRIRRKAIPERYRALLIEACERHGVAYELALAVMAVESNFEPRAVSKAGAQGLMQLMPATAAELSVEDPFDPEQNISGGVRYLRYLTDLFEGDLTRVIAAYNAGPNAVSRAGGVPNFPETRAYLARVQALYEHYKALRSMRPADAQKR